MAAPKLRFQEFDGDWSQSRIGEIFQVTSGSTPLRSDNRFFENADIAWVKTTDLNNGLIEKTEEKISQIALKETSVKILPKGTVFVAMYGGFNQIGRTGLLVDEAACNQALSAIYPNEKIESYFLLTFLNHKVDDWKNFAASSRKDPNITKSDVLAFPLTYPVKEEQTKIASFLSSVDEKISQLTQKHELLSQYKQGMMQKLFSQQIRFKADDGSEFGEWEETTLGEKGSFLKGKGISKADIAEDGILPCIRYGELYTIYGEIISNVISATNLDRDSLILSKANDVLIPASGETQIDIATASCVLEDDIALSGDLNIYRTKENGAFLSYMIRSSLKMQIAQLAQGNSVVHLYSSQLKGVQLSLPCLEEQTKIANFLSSIDQKIEVVVQQIEQAKHWKKGLLQQMFV